MPGKHWRLLSMLLALGLCACAGRPDAVRDTATSPVWPPPPEPALYRAEALIRYIEDVRAPSAGEDLMRTLGAAGPARTPAFVKPYAVAARHGQVYVSDQGTASVHVFDVPRRRFHRFGHRGPGQLRKPTGLAIGADLRIYVADAGRRQVLVYDRLGLPLSAIGSPRELVQPVAVAVAADGRLFVLDRGGMDTDRHRVLVFDPAGSLERTLGGLGSGPGSLRLPMDIAVTDDNLVVVLDSGNFRVQTWRPDGTPVAQWGAAGSGPGDFGRPRSLAIDESGIIYVADSFFSDIKAFRPDGLPLLPIGGKGDGATPGSFSLLAGIAGDETGRLYAIDQATRSLHVLRRLAPVAEIHRAAEPDRTRPAAKE